MSDLIVDFPSNPIFRGTNNSNKKTCSCYSVSFDSKAEVRYIENLTFEYKAELWFSKHDMQRFKYDAAIDVQTIRQVMNRQRCSEEGDDCYSYLDLLQQETDNDTTANNDTTSFLGLERHLSKSTVHNIVNGRRRLLNAIFAEQARQRRMVMMQGEGYYYDADMLAYVSEVESDWSRQRAHVIGLLHASC